MKKLLLLAAHIFPGCFGLYAQSNCASPTKINICPATYLANETNLGKGDDAPAPCNIAGEDVVYEISAPNGAGKIFVSITNASAPLNLSLELTTCGNGVCNQQTVAAGNSNVTFNVASTSLYYLWVDAAATVTYNIAIGGDTGSVWVSIPNTQGWLRFDSSGCALPPFMASKPFFQVKYNGIFKTSPMTLSPLFSVGTMCVVVFFKNPTGIEGVKKFVFHFLPAGYSSVTAAASIPGFYNAGNWLSSNIAGDWTWQFSDAAATGKGDFTGSPNTCLRYEFCFNVIPISNSPVNTNVTVNITSDGFGAGFTGFVPSGCCPAATPNCLGGGAGSGSTHGFGFGFNDPGLPVSLIDFNAKFVTDKVYVNWKTASEINNDYFTVEKTRDKNNWIIVDKVKGAGNSTTIKSYEFVDRNPFDGISYYRLKQTDYNGSFEYSIIKKVVSSNQTIDAAIYPNPASDILTIKYDNTGDMNFIFYNSLGDKIILPATGSDHESQIETKKLPCGLYMLVMMQKNEIVRTEKIVIER